MAEIRDDSWKYRFNKDFNLNDWLEMEPPPHMSESDWRFAVMELHTLLQTEAGRKEPDKLFLGWKSKHGLI
jgi:hypothetical protein